MLSLHTRPVISGFVEDRLKSDKKKARGRPGLTLEEVARACEALKNQGRVVGPTNVRLEIGRGSFATITRCLRELGYERHTKKQ